VKISRQLLGAAAWTIGGSLAATFAFGGGATLTGRQVMHQTLENILFSGSCVTLCIVGLPIVVPFAHRKFPMPVDWMVIVATLVLFGLAGSYAGVLAGVGLGLLPARAHWFGWYPGVVKSAVFFTVIFGLSGSLVAQLRSRLASTTVALRTKERDEAEARRLAAEARLASLEARVDPHFLFNTLNSIAALVRDKPADAERVIEQLSSLMRSSLDRKQSLVTLEDELELVRNYLEIERVRFGDRLRFHIDAGDGTAKGRVPRMSLQTLVENSVKYAVSTSREGASIRVRAARDGDRLHLTVEDDGPGFDPAQLPDGHGLHLLKSRIAMTFDGRGDLRIASRPGLTAVTLDLPFETVA
jgi:two-component system LytT family sensor kinase